MLRLSERKSSLWIGPWVLLIFALPAAAEQEERVLASYQNTITEQEFDAWKLATGAHDGEEFQRALLNELILKKTLAAKAVEIQLDLEPAVQMRLELAKGALALGRLRQAVSDSVVIPAEQAEAKYQEIKDTYTQPRRVRLRNLFKRFPPGASEAQKAEVFRQMEDLHRRLRGGADFKQLATTESDSQTRLQGGLIGNVSAGTFPPAVDEIAMAMQPGEISRILEGPDGLTLLYCEKILDKVTRTPEDLRQVAKDILTRREAKEKQAELDNSLLSESTIHWSILEQEAPDHEAIAVEGGPGAALSVAEVDALLQISPLRVGLATATRERIRSVVEAFLLRRAALQRVEDQRLWTADLAADWHWGRLDILAESAKLHFVQEAFVAPTEAEVEAFWRERKDDFPRKPYYDLSVIRLHVEDSKEGKAEAHRRAEELAYRIQNGELGFAEAAREFSGHPSADRGGRLEPQSRRLLPHRFGFKILRQLLAMESGQVSAPVAEGNYLWILQLHEIEPARNMTWPEARELAERTLGTERARSIEVALVEKWSRALKIDFSP